MSSTLHLSVSLLLLMHLNISRRLRNLFAELDQSALDQIEAQFHQNALEWSQRQAKRLGRAPVALQVGDLVLELDAVTGPRSYWAPQRQSQRSLYSESNPGEWSGDTDNWRHILQAAP